MPRAPGTCSELFRRGVEHQARDAAPPGAAQPLARLSGPGLVDPAGARAPRFRKAQLGSREPNIGGSRAARARLRSARRLAIQLFCTALKLVGVTWCGHQVMGAATVVLLCCACHG